MFIDEAWLKVTHNSPVKDCLIVCFHTTSFCWGQAAGLTLPLRGSPKKAQTCGRIRMLRTSSWLSSETTKVEVTMWSTAETILWRNVHMLCLQVQTCLLNNIGFWPGQLVPPTFNLRWTDVFQHLLACTTASPKVFEIFVWSFREVCLPPWM